MIEKLRKTWKPMPVTVILGVLAAYYFGITGAFWAVTGEFTRWGASLMKMCGVDISKYSYLKLIHYKGTILTRVDGVMILGMFLGMFIAAALSNNITIYGTCLSSNYRWYYCWIWCTSCDGM